MRIWSILAEGGGDGEGDSTEKSCKSSLKDSQAPFYSKMLPEQTIIEDPPSVTIPTKVMTEIVQDSHKHCVRAVDDTTFQSMMERQYELLRKEHMKEIDDGKQRPAEETHSAPVEPVGNSAEKVDVQSHKEHCERTAFEKSETGSVNALR
uniref:Uncharacterized protein n=1 Tax=Timema bartmani TaxID=61472 RepID=A0A7R9I4V5_9NEOP|nr:unnamed protein product [Timema bartmani]